MKKQVFEGLKVADFSWVGVGPVTAREFAEHGATVVRVESHKRPDTLRVMFPFKDGIPGIDRSAFGAAYNTNKYGMSLDLGTEEGKEIAYKLVKWADVMTDGMVPGTMAKWGLDYESARQINPGIIYFSTTQQGQFGPYSQYGGYGMFAAVMGGFSHLTGWPDRDPLPLANNYTDFIAPWYLIIAVIGALLRRRKTGRGLYIDQAQIEAGINFLGPSVLDFTTNGRVANRMGARDREMCPHGAYPCQGTDRWVSIAVQDDTQWIALCHTLGHVEVASDPRYDTFLARKENEDALDKMIGEWTAAYPAEQVMTMLQGAGIPASVVQTCEDLFNDPQLKHRNHFRVLEHRVIGPHAYQSPAYHLSKTPAEIVRPGPCLGEHNEHVYQEILGLDEDQLAELLIEGVITTEDDVPDVLKGK